MKRPAQGTSPWFHMVGDVLCRAAIRARLPDDRDLTLVERYLDGAERDDGLVQGLRVSVTAGEPSYRVGVGSDDRGDVTIEVMSATARRLNLSKSADPSFQTLVKRAVASGDLVIRGDLSRFGPRFAGVHDEIVDRPRRDVAVGRKSAGSQR